MSIAKRSAASEEERGRGWVGSLKTPSHLAATHPRESRVTRFADAPMEELETSSPPRWASGNKSLYLHKVKKQLIAVFLLPQSSARGGYGESQGLAFVSYNLGVQLGHGWRHRLDYPTPRSEGLPSHPPATFAFSVFIFH